MDSDGRNGDPRPFSTDELENYTGDWSLSCDMRLLSNFKSISGSMFDRADHVMAALNDISYKTQEKAVKVSNVVNDLQILATNQFIENRVYEESEEAIPAVSEPAIGDGNQQDLMLRIKASLNGGIKFITQTFPDVDIEDDSDEEDNIRDVLHTCKRQNRFLVRKLPPVIGGPEFSRENFVSLFRSHNFSTSPEVGTDAVDAFIQNEPANDSDEDRKSEADIVISSSDSEDMFMQTENKQPSAVPHFQNIFSDSSSPEVDNFSRTKPNPVALPSNPLLFQDELNRRLLGNKLEPGSIQKSEVSTTMPQNFRNTNTTVSEQKQDNSSGSSMSGSAFRDRLSNLFADSEPASPPQPSHEERENVISGSRQPVARTAQPVPASRKLLDFLSDDDDDDFDIFKTKLTTKERQSERVSKLFESDDSDSEQPVRRDRKPLPAKDSDSRQGPQKEVGDALRSETRLPVQSLKSVAREPLPPDTTASLFSEGDHSSEDDLFTTRVRSSSPPQASINSTAKSQVRQVDEVKTVPVSHTQGKKADLLSDSSDSSPEEMNRSAILNKLEKTIFGNKTRKPTGGISLFGDSSSAEKSANDETGDAGKSSSTVKPSILEAKVVSEAELKPQSSARSSEDDLLAGDILKKSVTLSSQAVKSRPKVQNRRRPTRAALKSPSSDNDGRKGLPLDEAVASELPLKPEKPTYSQVVAGVAVEVSEAKNTASIKSDANENSSIVPQRTQIPHSDAHQLETGNLISDPDSQLKNESSKTVTTTTITASKSILSDDSDEELFAATPQDAPSNATAVAKPSLTTATTITQTTKQKALFSDSEDDDIFSKTKKTFPSSDKQTKISSARTDRLLFDSSDDESSPLKTEEKMTVKAAGDAKAGAKSVAGKLVEDDKKKETKQSSLFSDDSDDDDLFTSKRK